MTKYYRYLVKDIENERTVEAPSSLTAMQVFIQYYYGGVIYTRSITVERLES